MLSPSSRCVPFADSTRAVIRWPLRRTRRVRLSRRRCTCHSDSILSFLGPSARRPPFWQSRDAWQATTKRHVLAHLWTRRACSTPPQPGFRVSGTSIVCGSWPVASWTICHASRLGSRGRLGHDCSAGAAWNNPSAHNAPIMATPMTTRMMTLSRIETFCISAPVRRNRCTDGDRGSN